MQPTQLHEDDFLRMLWDEELVVIGIDWKEATAAMTDNDFKAKFYTVRQLRRREESAGHSDLRLGHQTFWCGGIIGSSI